MKIKKSSILKDSRFISIVDKLKTDDKLLAIYLVRLVTGFGLAAAKKYIENSDKFLKLSSNPLQYK